jgi:hypothetical protein
MADEIVTLTEPQPTVKPAWQSKTMLLNGIGGLITFAALFLPQAMGIQTWIDGHGTEVLLIWQGLSMLLRFVTKDKVVLTN